MKQYYNNIVIFYVDNWRTLIIAKLKHFHQLNSIYVNYITLLNSK